MASRLRLLGQMGRNVCKLATQGRPRIHYEDVRCFRILSRLDVEAQKILMPSLSPTMSEGSIVKWHKKEGDSIAAGDILCDIETDKAVVSLEVDDDGIVAKIIKPENSKNVKIGSLIALMVPEGENWEDVDVPAADDSVVVEDQTETVERPTAPQPTAMPSSPAPQAAAAMAAASSDSATKVKMPALSPTMESGTIVKWHKKEGDSFAAGDILCDVETDKAVVSFEVDDEGILARIIKPEGSKDVVIGELIALTVADGEDWKNVTVPSDTSSGDRPVTAAVTSEGVQPPPSSSVQPPPSQMSAPSSIPFGPAVRNMLEVYQISAVDVTATGPGGRLTKSDLLQYIMAKSLKPAPVPQTRPVGVSTPVTQVSVPPASTVQPSTPAGSTPQPSRPQVAQVKAPDGQPFVDIQLTDARRIAAQRLTQSKATVPHSYSSIDCNVENVIQLLNDLEEEGVMVTLNDILIKAVAVTLQILPDVNATWTGAGPRILGNIDIATTVTTNGDLVAPVIKNAASLGLREISLATGVLTEKARSGSLLAAECEGGTFTLSNLSTYDVSEFSAVVIPPSSSTLTVGSTHTELDDDALSYPSVTVTLCSDCRVVDDVLAARFLATFRNIIEKPMLMLSEAK